jgi:type I restriction enzyme S subunit
MANFINASTNISIPTDWRLCSLGEITVYSQYGISSSSGEDCTVPVLRMNNLQDGHIDLKDLSYIKLSKAELESLVLSRGDLLLNRTNSYDLVGKTAVYDMEGQHVFASYLVRFRLSPSVLPAFVNYYLNSSNGQRKLKRLATKAVSQANINPSTLKKRLLVPIPPLSEQRKIVEILAMWDSAIDLTAQLIAAKQLRKRGLMQQLLTGKRRFKEFVLSEEMQHTEIGLIPLDWNYVNIATIAQQVSRRNSGKLELPTLSCTKYSGLVDSLKYFGRKIFSDDTSAYKVVRRHQFAYATNHIEEGSIGYQDLYDEALISPMYTVFETNATVDDHFLYALLKTETYRQIFESSTSASVDRRGSLRWNEFSRIKVPLPCIPEQKRIAEVLDTCDQELELLNRKLELLKKQKRGLMQQLLTGKVRVKV